MRGSGLLLGHSPWCCGSLQTGSISVGFTNVVSISLLFLWLVQTLLDLHHALIAVIVSSLVVFILGVVNVCLIYGAQQRQKSMLAPWLVIYLLFQLGLLIALPLMWNDMGPVRLVAVGTLGVLCYCYFVVTSYFNELKSEDDEAAKVSADAEAAGAKPRVAQNGGACLIMMDSPADAAHDDTFTALMHRPAPPRHSDSASGDFALPVNSRNGNPFMGMGQAESKGEEEFQASFLPKPEEVIAIDPAKRLSGVSRNPEALPGLVEELEEEQETLLGGAEDEEDEVFVQPKITQQQLKRQKSAADARAVDESMLTNTSLLPRPKISNSACDVTDGGGEGSHLLQLSVASSSATVTENRSMSVSGLVDIDTSFTPFKKKESVADGVELPKMKIFLPQGADDSDSDDSSSSSSEEEEEEEEEEKEKEEKAA